MPQPYRLQKPFTVSPDALGNRPQLAALVAQCIAAFARVDIRWATVLSAALAVEEELALEIYLVLRSDTSRANVFDTVLKTRLSKEDYDEACALRKEMKSLVGRRNEFAHDVWGISPDLPDEAILVPAAEAIRWLSAQTTLGMDELPGQRHTVAETERYLADVTDLERRIVALQRRIPQPLL